jgi:hypothetical protein
MIQQIDDKLMEKIIRKLSVEIGPRPYGSDNCKKATQYLYDEFKNCSLDVYFDNFGNGRNVVATLNGTNTSATYYIIGGHVDTVSGSPGADDNGGGTAATLAAGIVMSQYTFNKTIKFIPFDGEEAGLIGSRHYAKNAKQNNHDIGAMLNADMIGYRKQGQTFVVLRTATSGSNWLKDFIDDIANKYQAYIGLTVKKSGGGGSDHVAFEKMGYSAVHFFEATFNPQYHSPSDKIDIMDLVYTANVTQLMVATLAELAEVQGGGGVKIPDLTLTSNDISFSNPNPNEGDKIEISAEIHNVGNENASNVNIDFYVDNISSSTKIGDTQNVGDILAGQSKTAKVEWDTTGYGGDHIICVVTDPKNSVNEGNENNNIANKSIYVKPKPPPSILLKSPIGGEKWKGYSKQDIIWTIKEGDKPYEVTISYSEDDGINYQYLDKVNQPEVGEGSYEWHIPDINSDKVRIKVVVNSSTGKTSECISDRLLIDSQHPQISVVSPSAGVYWNAGQKTLEWIANDNFGIKPKSVQINYSIDNGQSWKSIASNIDGTTYNWLIPNTINSQQCLIRVDVQDIVGHVGSKISDKFTIDTKEPIIDHQPVKSGITGSVIPVTAIIKDNFGIETAKLNYKEIGSVSFVSVDMTYSGNTYTANIPSQSSAGIVEYYISVEDKATNHAETTKYKVDIKDATQFGSISGKVKDAITGKIISGAKVTAFKQGKVVDSVSTTSDGAYNFAGLSPATYKLRAEKEGYDSVEVEVVVSAGKNTVQNFELYPDGVEVGNVAGIVVDEDGKPIKDATVHLDGKRTETNRKGEFIFRNVKPGKYTVKVSKAGYDDSSKQVTVEPRKTEEIEITLYKKGEKPVEIPKWVYGAIVAVIAVLVILSIIAVIVKRRKRPPSQYQYPPGWMGYGTPSYPQPPTQMQQPPVQLPPTQISPTQVKVCRRCGVSNENWRLSCTNCKSKLG